jgi:hypothetical protein
MRTHLRIKAATAIALAVGAGAAAPASARFDQYPPTAPAITAPTAGHATIAEQFAQRHEPTATFVVPRSRVVSGGGGRLASHPRVISIKSSSDRGFQWAEAGIGAAGGLVLSLLAMAGGLAVTQRREQEAKGQPAQPATP